MRIELAEPVCTALQFAQACLPQTSITGRIVNAVLKSSDEEQNPQLQIISLELNIRQPDGTDELVWVNCHLVLTDGGWTQGLCRINRNTPELGWFFSYDMSVPNLAPRLLQGT